MFSFAQASGLDANHIDNHSLEQPVHKQMVAAMRALKEAAQSAGFTLMIASGYRSFERQKKIWNAKASGLRSVLDADGRALDLTTLRDEEKLHAILRWSALPGASRHHFGTDIDVYDPTLLPEGYSLQLTQEESRTGPLAALHDWLDSYLAAGDCDFFRPYVAGDFGVAPEPWHLSYAPLSWGYQAAVTPQALADLLVDTDVLLKDQILGSIEELLARYVQVPQRLYPPKTQSYID